MYNETETPKPRSEVTSGFVAVQSEHGMVMLEAVGTAFLGMLALVLLFSLLRAQKRNRQLMRELMEAKEAQHAPLAEA